MVCMQSCAKKMLLSSEKKFVFVHIPKNAGTSIRKALARYNDSYKKRNLLQRVVSKFTLFNKYPISPPIHISACNAKKWIGDQRWNELYSFAVIRNPWDWQVSLYEYTKQTKNHYQHHLINSFNSFDDYISWRCHEDLTLQSDFVTDESKSRIIVKDIYRFESIKNDLERLELHIGAKITLKHLNQVNHANYRHYYTDHAKDMVAEYFAEDINRFEYEF